MKELNSGLSHLCHHDQHYECCYDKEERVRYINAEKHASEVEVRLKYFQIIPLEELPKELAKALEENRKARKHLIRVEQFNLRDRRNADQVQLARTRNRKARVARQKAFYRWMAPVNSEQREVMHTKLWPDCPFRVNDQKLGNEDGMFTRWDEGDKKWY